MKHLGCWAADVILWNYWIRVVICDLWKCHGLTLGYDLVLLRVFYLFKVIFISCVKSRAWQEWIEAAILEQWTHVFWTHEIVQGTECEYLMDSGSQINFVSQSLVFFLNLPTKRCTEPYNASWVTQDCKTPITRSCLVEFLIGRQYKDKIWCDVIPMDMCHVLLGWPWQWERNILYWGGENVYELKVNSQLIKLYPQIKNTKQERLSTVMKEVTSYTRVCPHKREEKKRFTKPKTSSKDINEDSRASLSQPGEFDMQRSFMTIIILFLLCPGFYPLQFAPDLFRWLCKIGRKVIWFLWMRRSFKKKLCVL